MQLFAEGVGSGAKQRGCLLAGLNTVERTALSLPLQQQHLRPLYGEHPGSKKYSV